METQLMSPKVIEGYRLYKFSRKCLTPCVRLMLRSSTGTAMFDLHLLKTSAKSDSNSSLSSDLSLWFIDPSQHTNNPLDTSDPTTPLSHDYLVSLG